MRDLPLKNQSLSAGESSVLIEFSKGVPLERINKEDLFNHALSTIATYDQFQYYPLVGKIFNQLGLNCKITRAGDTNNRTDGYIIDDINSIPMEIKSATESRILNIKSVRQALENKIILLSRKFYPTNFETTSLAVGQDYPPGRSDISELIQDIYKTYKINIGLVSMGDLLDLCWAQEVQNVRFDFKKLYSLKGTFS